MPLFSSLSHRPFALIWSGQTVSRLGDSLYRIALAWWVLEKTGSAAVMGTVLIFSFVPMLIFSLVGGVFVDRLPRVTVMLASDLLRGLVVGGVTLLAYTKTLEVWHVYVASVLFGFVNAFFQPAYTALLPEIALKEILPSANSLTSLSGQFANIVGPGLGGLLVGFGGTSIAFALNSASFFISAACLAPLLKLSLPSHSRTEGLRFDQELWIGVKTVFTSPWLWITITIAALLNVTVSGPMSVALPFLVKDALHQDARLQGLLTSLYSVGSVITAVWLGRNRRLNHRGLIAYAAMVMVGLAILVYGLPVALVLIFAAALLNGAMLIVFELIWTNTLQEMIPGDLLGRVSSIDMLGSFVLPPVGYAVAGVLTDKIGPAWVFVLGGAVTALLAGIGLFHPAIRKLD